MDERPRIPPPRVRQSAIDAFVALVTALGGTVDPTGVVMVDQGAPDEPPAVWGLVNRSLPIVLEVLLGTSREARAARERAQVQARELELIGAACDVRSAPPAAGAPSPAAAALLAELEASVDSRGVVTFDDDDPAHPWSVEGARVVTHEEARVLVAWMRQGGREVRRLRSTAAAQAAELAAIGSGFVDRPAAPAADARRAALDDAAALAARCGHPELAAEIRRLPERDPS